MLFECCYYCSAHQKFKVEEKNFLLRISSTCVQYLLGIDLQRLHAERLIIQSWSEKHCHVLYSNYKGIYEDASQVHWLITFVTTLDLPSLLLVSFNSIYYSISSLFIYSTYFKSKFIYKIHITTDYINNIIQYSLFHVIVITVEKLVTNLMWISFLVACHLG